MKLPDVTYRKLGKEKVWGWAHLGDGVIEIDSRLKGYRKLLYLVHELLHIMHPDWSETKVRKESSIIARFIWREMKLQICGE